jgi:hypothetical protein
VVSAVNYRWPNTHRAAAPRWTDQVREATARCAADPALARVILRGAAQPFWSIVIVPCDRIRTKPVPCLPPACVWLDPPLGVGVTTRP